MGQTLTCEALAWHCAFQALIQDFQSYQHSDVCELPHPKACKHNRIQSLSILYCPHPSFGSARLRFFEASAWHLPSPSDSSRLRLTACQWFSPPPAYASSKLRRGTSLPLRVRPVFALRLAEPKLSFAERRLVEVRGVEPLSETAPHELLRVYPAFNLDQSTPTGGLIPKQPFGYTNCGARAESSAASPAELCRSGVAGVCRATSGP